MYIINLICGNSSEDQTFPILFKTKEKAINFLKDMYNMTKEQLDEFSDTGNIDNCIIKIEKII